MIEALAVIALIWIAISAVYMMKNKKSTGSEDQYVWVGQGDNPFKK